MRELKVMSLGTNRRHLGSHPILTLCGRRGWVANSSQLPYLTVDCKACQAQLQHTQETDEER